MAGHWLSFSTSIIEIGLHAAEKQAFTFDTLGLAHPVHWEQETGVVPLTKLPTNVMWLHVTRMNNMCDIPLNRKFTSTSAANKVHRHTTPTAVTWRSMYSINQQTACSPVVTLITVSKRRERRRYSKSANQVHLYYSNDKSKKTG